MNVVLALPQGRKRNLDRIKSVKQILSKLTLFNFIEHVYVGGPDHAHVDFLGFRRPYLDEFPRLEHPQQAHLSTQGKLPDLVQEDGSAVGLFKIAFSSPGRTGKGPLLVTKKFRINGALRNCPAVDRYQGGMLAVRQVVNNLGDVLLAHAAFARHQYRNIGGSDLNSLIQGAVQRGLGPDDTKSLLDFLNLHSTVNSSFKGLPVAILVPDSLLTTFGLVASTHTLWASGKGLLNFKSKVRPVQREFQISLPALSYTRTIKPRVKFSMHWPSLATQSLKTPDSLMASARRPSSRPRSCQVPSASLV